MNEIVKRLKSETPKFFKRLQVFGGSLAALGVALLNVPGLPENIKHITEHLVWIGPVVALIAQFAVVNTTDLQEDEVIGV